MNYKKVRIYVGSLVTIFFTALIILGYLFLEKKGVFNKSYTYYTYAENAMVFKAGMAVKYSGFDIGMISDIDLETTEKVKIVISIDEHYRRFITVGSELVLTKPLFGLPYIELKKTSNKKLLPVNGKMKMVITDDINDMIARLQPIAKKLINIVENLETITGEIASDNSPLNKSLVNLEKFTSKLANDDSLLTTVTGDKTVAKKLVISLDSLEKTFQNIQSISNDLNTTIANPTSASINNINAILLDIKQKLKKLNPTVDTIAKMNPEIKNIKKDIQYATSKSNELLDKVDGLLNDDKKILELP